jgi:hypothetical protein
LFGFVFQTEVCKHAIVAVNRRLAERFAVNRYDAFADFARGFSEKLFEPRAEVMNAGRRDDRNFVASVNCRCAKDGAENGAGILVCGDACAASFHHLVRVL